MKKTIRSLAALFILSAIAVSSSTGCVVRERRDDRPHHEEIIVR